MAVKNFAYNIYKIINEAFDFNDNNETDNVLKSVQSRVHDLMYFKDCKTSLQDYCMQEYGVKLRKFKCVINTEFGPAYYLRDSSSNISIFPSRAQYNEVFPDNNPYIHLNYKRDSDHANYDNTEKSIIIEYVTNIIKLILPDEIDNYDLSIHISKDSSLLYVTREERHESTYIRVLCFNPINFNDLIKNNLQKDSNEQLLTDTKIHNKLLKYFSEKILKPEFKLDFSISDIAKDYMKFYTSSDGYTYMSLNALIYPGYKDEICFKLYSLPYKYHQYSRLMLLIIDYEPEIYANTEILNTTKINGHEYLTSAKYSSINGTYEIYWTYDFTKGTLIDKEQKLTQSNILDVFNNTGINLNKIKQIADYYTTIDNPYTPRPNHNDIIFYGAIKLTDKGQKIFNLICKKYIK